MYSTIPPPLIELPTERLPEGVPKVELVLYATKTLLPAILPVAVKSSSDVETAVALKLCGALRVITPLTFPDKFIVKYWVPL